jgi:hypothetical protein
MHVDSRSVVFSFDSEEQFHVNLRTGIASLMRKRQRKWNNLFGLTPIFCGQGVE